MPKLPVRARTVDELDAEIDAMTPDKLRDFAKGMIRAAARYETVAVAVDAFISAKVGKRIPKVDTRTAEFNFDA